MSFSRDDPKIRALGGRFLQMSAMFQRNRNTNFYRFFAHVFILLIRRALENNEEYEFREFQSPYNHVFAPEKCSLRLKNNHFGQVSSLNTNT